MLCFHMPCMVMVDVTSNGSQNDIGNSLGFVEADEKAGNEIDMSCNLNSLKGVIQRSI